jgi:hypothetical protein
MIRDHRDPYQISFSVTGCDIIVIDWNAVSTTPPHLQLVEIPVQQTTSIEAFLNTITLGYIRLQFVHFLKLSR